MIPYLYASLVTSNWRDVFFSSKVRSILRTIVSAFEWTQYIYAYLFLDVLALRSPLR